LLLDSTEIVEPNPGMAELLDSMEPVRSLQRGEFVTGVVMRIDEEGILVSMSQKHECMIPIWEMRSMSSEARTELTVGDDILAMVVKSEGGDSPAILSLDKAHDEMGWRIMDKAFKEGEQVQGKVLRFNRGGAIVDVEGVQGFVPLSQLVTITSNISDDQADQADIETQNNDSIGQILDLKILELDRSRNRAILSERNALQQLRDAKKEKLLEELKEGDIVPGKVSGVSNFGAFVDLGGADGLVHISELSWETIDSPEDVVKAGDSINVYILKLDKENKRISLSLRRTQPTPWDTIHERYQEGQVVEATITKLTDFGAFARLENGIEGLVHISELTDTIIKHPSDVVSEGDVTSLKILKIELDRKRLGLSLKQATQSEE